MDVPYKYIQTRANECIQRKQEFAWSSSMKINMNKGLVWTKPLLTRVYIPPNGCPKIVGAMVCDTLASCVRTLFIRGMIRWHNALWLGTQGTSPFVHVSKCRSEWSSKGLERKRSRVLDCLCAWAAWVCGAMALPHSFLLPFSLFLFSLFLFFLLLFFISLPFFLSFFISLPFFSFFSSLFFWAS